LDSALKTLNNSRGQALTEFLILLPLWVIVWTGFWQWHQRVHDSLEATRLVRSLLCVGDQVDVPDSLKGRVLDKRTSSLRNRQGEKPQGLPPEGTQWPTEIPPPPLGLDSLLDPLISRRQATLTIEGVGLWPDHQFDGVILVPGTQRKRLWHWAAGLGLSLGW
jgi:hypothetical protein